MSLLEDLSEFDGVVEGDEKAECTVVLPSTGRGLSLPDITEIKLPSVFFEEVGVPNVQSLAYAKPQPTAAKGRAYQINESQRKYRRPGREDIPSTDVSHSENNLSARNEGSHVTRVPYQRSNAAQTRSTFDEDFPPLSSGCIAKVI